MFARLAELERSGSPAAVATVVRAEGSVPRHEGSRMLIFPDGQIEGTIGGGEMESRVIAKAKESIQSGETHLLTYEFRDPSQGDVGVCGGEIEVYIEPLQPQPTVVVIGAGHVGKAVAHLAKWLGFAVILSDDREEFADETAIPEADQYHHGPISTLPKELDIHRQTFILLTTRGVAIDVEGLPALIESPAAYIGVIGSRRRWETTASALLENGVPQEAIDRISSPMGLELNAETPEEIAVSILAEIILQKQGGTGESMAHKISANKGAGGSSH